MIADSAENYAPRVTEFDYQLDDRYVTACHEAGHAVASVLRGGGELRSITIERTEKYLGHTGLSRKAL